MRKTISFSSLSPPSLSFIWIFYLFVHKLSICLYIVDCILRLLDDRYILILGLCERVKDQDKALLERTLPVLQQRLHKTGAALTDCSMVSERIQEWQVLFYQYGMAFSLWGFFLLLYMRWYTKSVWSVNKITLRMKTNF